MTQKTSTKKVTKNIERPRPIRGNREVIRHFDPSINTAAYSNLNVNIPFVNVDPSPSEEHKSEKSASKPIKTVKTSGATRNHKPNNNKSRFNLDIKSSSSSSLGTKLEKFITKSPGSPRGDNKPKPKSKSFHLGPTHTRNAKNSQNVVSTSRERRLPVQAKNNTHLRSSTDPALIEKELNVKQLKQEILDNKRETVHKVYHPEAWGPIIDPRVEDLKSEISQSKTNNIFNKKIFITELKSEVARYKNCGNFMVYNVEEDAKKKQENNKQHLSTKKVIIQDDDENRDTYSARHQNQNIQPNIGPSSDRSSSSTSIDKHEACSGSSSTTAKEICKPAFVSRDQSDIESLDDEALKNKIQEANQLINEVKKALGKIKAVKNCDIRVGRSSSTDIEETIKNLKKETARLITGHENEFNKSSQVSLTLPEEPRISLDVQVPREDHTSSSGVCLKQPEEPRKSVEQNVIEDDITKQLPSEELISSSEELIRKSSEKIQIEDEIRKLLGKPENERPKTRRNETEDESEQLRMEKFRNCPETGTLNISSSFEELQEKLQTISETTESSSSSPRKKTIDPLIEHISKGCNPTQLIEHKEIQVKPYLANVGNDCCCSTKEKDIQVTPQKNLTMEATTASSLSPKRSSLDSTHLPVQEIKPISKCAHFRIELLPTIETVAPLTKKKLSVELTGAISLPSKLPKKMLTIQRLPDIIIEPGLTLTPVLHLSISPVGQSKNDVENTDNVQYIEIVHRFPNDEEKVKIFVPVPSKKSLENARKSMSKLVKSQKDKWSSLLESRSSENAAAEFLKDFELGNKLTAEEEEDLKQKLLYYKSYHIYDNPNDHNPGELTAKSISKFSQMDIDVYKTFINPNPNLADKEYFASSQGNQKNKKYSFESKTVQCSDSEVIRPITTEAAPYKSNATEEIECKTESCKVDKATSMLQTISEETIKEVHYLPEYSNLDYKTSSLLLASEFAKENRESIKSNNKSSLSEITLTISYTLSSESSQSSNGDIGKKNSESEMTVTTAANSKITDVNKTFSVADKDIISRLQNKLKSIDIEGSNPTIIMDKNSENWDTLDNFLKGLTHFEEREESLRKRKAECEIREEQRRGDRKSKDEHHKHKDVKKEKIKGMSQRSRTHEDDQTTKNRKHEEKHQDDLESGPSQEPLNDLKPKNNPTVNYLIQQKMLEDPYKHLELGKNGRYKDEEDLFTNMQYPNEKSNEWPLYPKDISDVKTTFVQKDKEVASDKLRTIPRDRFNRLSPDTSNSETVTTTVSEGEILCRHSISNGEIHVCRPRLPTIPRFRLSKSSISKRHLSYTPKYRCSHSHCHKVSPRRFDLNDPSVSIEQRRNYFNNWVTYYVQSQDASNCYNKQE